MTQSQLEFKSFIIDHFDNEAIVDVATENNWIRSAHDVGLTIMSTNAFESVLSVTEKYVSDKDIAGIAAHWSILIAQVAYLKANIAALYEVNLVIEDAKNKAAVQS